MKKNIGKIDRVIRILIAIVASLLYITQTVSGTLGIVVLIIGAIALVTAVLNLCGLYMLFGISTCPKE